MIEDTKVVIVHLDKFSCACGAWQISGIPCKHVLACIANKKGDSNTYVDKSLTKEAYLPPITT